MEMDNTMQVRRHKFYLNAARVLISQIVYLFNTRAPFALFSAYFSQIIRNRQIKKQYLNESVNYQTAKQSLSLSNDWFFGNVPFWWSIIREYGYAEKPMKVLEIGSWEGLSSHFILLNMQNAHLMCVDVWQSEEEVQHSNSASTAILNRVESAFDRNLLDFKARLTKYKGTSFTFFHHHLTPGAYDLVYVDGSHHFDDVFLDAVKCFEMLKVGGIIIFDDYFWREFSGIDNPAAAINQFIRLKQHSLSIIRFYSQVVILKTKDDVLKYRISEEQAEWLFVASGSVSKA
jgi:predicted O-methyltransferase YrrM